MRYQLAILYPSGDTYVIDTSNNTMCGPLHYDDWQTNDDLDGVKVETAAWNFDVAFEPQDVTILHQWN